MTKICHQRIITWILILRLGRHLKTIVSKQKGLFINYVTQEQYTIVFLRKLVKQRRTDVISFCMQFEKMGCGLLREAFRSEGECFFGQKRGEIRKYIHSQISCVCFLLLEVLKCSPPFSRTYTFLFPPLLANKALTLTPASLPQQPTSNFSNCTGNDVTLVHRCLTSFRKKMYSTPSSEWRIFSLVLGVMSGLRIGHKCCKTIMFGWVKAY